MNGPDYWAAVEAAWEDHAPRPAPRRVGPVRGGVLAAVMLGLQEALEPQGRDEVVIEVPVDRPERGDERVRLHFDAGSPRRTVAVVGSLGR